MCWRHKNGILFANFIAVSFPNRACMLVKEKEDCSVFIYSFSPFPILFILSIFSSVISYEEIKSSAVTPFSAGNGGNMAPIMMKEMVVFPSNKAFFSAVRTTSVSGLQTEQQLVHYLANESNQDSSSLVELLAISCLLKDATSSASLLLHL